MNVSANDYAKWVAFLLSAWPPRDDVDAGPVNRASVRELVLTYPLLAGIGVTAGEEMKPRNDEFSKEKWL